jgi:hypothetical protein
MMIARYFYCHPYMLLTIFIKIKIAFAKFALVVEKNYIIFLHTFGIFAKCAILFFIWWKIVQLFTKKKRKEKKTLFQPLTHEG